MSISTIAAFTKNAATCLADVPTGNAAGHTNSTKNETASAVFTKRWRWLQLLLLIMATTWEIRSHGRLHEPGTTALLSRSGWRSRG